MEAGPGEVTAEAESVTGIPLGTPVIAGTIDAWTEAVSVGAHEPGDLMLFKGRYSLHRVTRVEGARPRFVAFLSYALMPDYIGSPRRVQQVYGRCLPVHLEAERSRVRADSLMD